MGGGRTHDKVRSYVICLAQARMFNLPQIYSDSALPLVGFIERKHHRSTVNSGFFITAVQIFAAKAKRLCLKRNK